MKNIAQKYKAAGLSCLPTGNDKMPATKAWKDVEVSINEFNSFGIAIKCGKASGNIECIDFDNHFGDAKDVISEFMSIEEVKEVYIKNKLPIQSTTSGGFHLLYRCPVVEGNKKLARRPKKDDKTGKYKADILIETRGEGGYFCVDPTPGYHVIKNSLLEINTITPEERGILLSAARSFNTWIEKEYHTDQDKERPGDLYNADAVAMDEVRHALEIAGWNDLGGGKWRRPGKDRGISATLGKAAPGIFYNFSSSAYPFDSDKGYTAFQVVGLLNYDGDFKRFATDLAERYNLNAKKEAYIGVPKKEEPEPNELEEILHKSFINLDIPVAKPPVIMRIKAKMGMNMGYSRVFTLGNFSAITGKSKSKKTFLTSLLMTAAISNSYYGKVFEADLPKGRTGVLLFDTEQSGYDAYITAKRVHFMLGYCNEAFGAFELREYSPLERCKIIEFALEKMRNNISYVVIDGIADLAMAINDEIEASRVVSLLMKWTKKYNIHITLVIHQNKNDEFATGHLGSAILKKAECIISVKKDTTDTSRSEVKCDLIRGAGDFDNFSFTINDQGLPIVEDTFNSKFDLEERI